MKTHHTMSRRDFMKAVGLGAAGAAGVAAAAPVFKDLDDVLSAGETLDKTAKRPWWVKERDIGKPTTNIDWDMIKPHDNRYILWTKTGRNYVFGDSERERLEALAAVNAKAGAEAKEGGFQLQDFALSAGVATDWFGSFIWNINDANAATYLASSWKNQPGLAQWQGSPEENSKLIRAAATFYGASAVGFCKIEEKEKVMFNSWHSEGRPFFFEDVDQAYDESADPNIGYAGKIVIPSNKQLYAIAIGIAFSKEIFRHDSNEHGTGFIRFSANIDRYRRWQSLVRAIQRFIRYFGYDAMGYPGCAARSVLPSGADAVLSGLVEHGRSNNVFISPEHGTCLGLFSIVTTMPVAPTAPIDAGIFRFCHTCHKCADTCPNEAISQEKEPTYEATEATYKYGDKPVKFCGNGKETFTYDGTACGEMTMKYQSSCTNCMGTCTFNVNPAMGIHDLVKPLVSTTGLLNGFLWRADGAFGFGLTQPDEKEAWWDMSLPAHGVDSTLTAFDGGYRKTRA